MVAAEREREREMGKLIMELNKEQELFLHKKTCALARNKKVEKK